MKLLKKINNNFALAEDSSGRVIIVSGKGIGFNKMPCEITDLSQVNRTYYNVEPSIVSLLSNVDKNVIDIAEQILEISKSTLRKSLNVNLTFTLADHIQFSLQRIEQGVHFTPGFEYELQYQYPAEYDIGVLAVRLINRKMNVNLPKEEAAIIAMHIIENEVKSKDTINNKSTEIKVVLGNIVKIVEKQLKISINEESFNYYRFITHMKHLLNRVYEGQINTENEKLFDEIKVLYPEMFLCAQNIGDYIEEVYSRKITNEEILYIVLHLNRLHVEEDCNR